MTDVAAPLAVRIEAQLRQFERQLERNTAFTAREFGKIERRATQFERELDRSTKRAADRIQANLNRGFSLRGIQNTIAALGVALSADEVRKYTDEWKEARAALLVAGVAQDKLNQKQVELYQIAQRSRSAIGDVTTLWARLAITSKDLQGDHAKLGKVVETVSKSMKLGKASTQEQAAAIRQFAQALGSGRLAGDELRSITENAPLLARSIADFYGVAIGELKDLGAQGKLTSEGMVNAVLQASRDIDAAYSQLPLTIGQSLTKLDNAFSKFIGQADTSAGVSTQIAAGISALAENFDEVAAAAEIVAALLAGRLAVSAAASGKAFLQKAAAARVAAVADAQAAQQAMILANAARASAARVLDAAAADLSAAKTKGAKSAATRALTRAEKAYAQAVANSTAAGAAYVTTAEAARQATSRLARAGRALRGAFAFVGGWPGLVLAAVAAFDLMSDSTDRAAASMDDARSAMDDVRDLQAKLTEATEAHRAAIEANAKASTAATQAEVANAQLTKAELEEELDLRRRILRSKIAEAKVAVSENSSLQVAAHQVAIQDETVFEGTWLKKINDRIDVAARDFAQGIGLNVGDLISDDEIAQIEEALSKKEEYTKVEAELLGLIAKRAEQVRVLRDLERDYEGLNAVPARSNDVSTPAVPSGVLPFVLEVSGELIEAADNAQKLREALAELGQGQKLDRLNFEIDEAVVLGKADQVFARIRAGLEAQSIDLSDVLSFEGADANAASLKEFVATLERLKSTARDSEGLRLDQDGLPADPAVRANVIAAAEAAAKLAGEQKSVANAVAEAATASERKRRADEAAAQYRKSSADEVAVLEARASVAHLGADAMEREAAILTRLQQLRDQGSNVDRDEVAAQIDKQRELARSIEDTVDASERKRRADEATAQHRNTMADEVAVLEARASVAHLGADAMEREAAILTRLQQLRDQGSNVGRDEVAAQIDKQRELTKSIEDTVDASERKRRADEAAAQYRKSSADELAVLEARASVAHLGADAMEREAAILTRLQQLRDQGSNVGRDEVAAQIDKQRELTKSIEDTVDASERKRRADEATAQHRNTMADEVAVLEARASVAHLGADAMEREAAILTRLQQLRDQGSNVGRDEVAAQIDKQRELTKSIEDTVDASERKRRADEATAQHRNTMADEVAVLEARASVAHLGADAMEREAAILTRLQQLRDQGSNVDRDEVAAQIDKQRELTKSIEDTVDASERKRRADEAAAQYRKSSADELAVLEARASVAHLGADAMEREAAILTRLQQLRDQGSNVDRDEVAAQIDKQRELARSIEDTVDASERKRRADEAAAQYRKSSADELAVLEARASVAHLGADAMEREAAILTRLQQLRDQGSNVGRDEVAAQIDKQRELTKSIEDTVDASERKRRADEAAAQYRKSSADELAVLEARASVAHLGADAMEREAAILTRLQQLRDQGSNVGRDEVAAQIDKQRELTKSIEDTVDASERKRRADEATAQHRNTMADEVAVLEARASVAHLGADAMEREAAILTRLQQLRDQGSNVDRDEVAAQIDKQRELARSIEDTVDASERKRRADEAVAQYRKGSADELAVLEARASVAHLGADAMEREAAILTRLQQLRDQGSNVDRDEVAAQIDKQRELARSIEDTVDASERKRRADEAVDAAKSDHKAEIGQLKAYTDALQEGVTAAEHARAVEAELQQLSAAGVVITDALRKETEGRAAAVRDANQANSEAVRIAEQFGDAQFKLSEIEERITSAKSALIAMLGDEAQAEEALGKARLEARRGADEHYKTAQAMLSELEGPQQRLAEFLEDERELRHALIDTLILQGETEAEAAEMAAKAWAAARAKLEAQTSAIRSALEELKDPAAALEESVVKMAKGMEDAFANFVQTGKFDFGSLVDSMIADLARLAFQQAVLQPLLSFASGAFGGGGGGFSIPGFADGGLIQGPGGPRDDKIPAMLSHGEYVVRASAVRRHLPLLQAINGGIGAAANSNVPRFSTGGLVGERLNNAARDINSSARALNQAPAVSVSPKIEVNIIGAPSQPQVRETQGDGGEVRIDVLFDQVERRIAENVGRGRGPLSSAIEQGYGAKRTLRR